MRIAAILILVCVQLACAVQPAAIHALPPQVVSRSMPTDDYYQRHALDSRDALMWGGRRYEEK